MRIKRNAIEQVARDADAAGLSYGQYVARQYETQTLREAARVREARERRQQEQRGKGTGETGRKEYQYKGTRVCVVCGEIMTNAHPSRRYCDNCRDDKLKQLIRDRNTRARTERKAGNETKRSWVRVCAWCGAEFLADTYARRYCSVECSGAADREHRAERMRRQRGKETE